MKTTSAQDFMMEFMKDIVHTKNTDQRPQLVQQWKEKLEARELELGRQFYERFKQATDAVKWDYDKLVAADGNGKTNYIYEQFLEAAKKAAGLE
jgi:hypothetical protein